MALSVIYVRYRKKKSNVSIERSVPGLETRVSTSTPAPGCHGVRTHRFHGLRAWNPSALGGTPRVGIPMSEFPPWRWNSNTHRTATVLPCRRFAATARVFTITDRLLCHLGRGYRSTTGKESKYYLKTELRCGTSSALYDA